MTCLVYRIEHRDDNKRGPYKCSRWTDDDILAGSVDRNHPMPWDIIERIRDANPGVDLVSNKYYFGFTDKSHLRNWFDVNSRHTLKANDYVISVYKVPSHEVYGDEYQCAFLLSEAVWIAELDLVHF